jgi:hypothetical protein
MTWAMLVSIPKTSNATKITNTKNRIENVLVDIALEKKKKLEQAKRAKQDKYLHSPTKLPSSVSPTKHPLVSLRDCVGIDHIQRERKEQEIKMEETHKEPHKEEKQTETKHSPNTNAKKQLTKTQVRKYQTEQKRRKREEENARCWEEIEKLVSKM